MAPRQPPPEPPSPTPGEKSYDDTLEDSFPASDPPPGVIALGPPRPHPAPSKVKPAA